MIYSELHRVWARETTIGCDLSTVPLECFSHIIRKLLRWLFSLSLSSLPESLQTKQTRRDVDFPMLNRSAPAAALMFCLCRVTRAPARERARGRAVQVTNCVHIPIDPHKMRRDVGDRPGSIFRVSFKKGEIVAHHDARRGQTENSSSSSSFFFISILYSSQKEEEEESSATISISLSSSSSQQQPAGSYKSKA